jgi:CYTH domain-containing protein
VKNKYSRIEREKRFLLSALPDGADTCEYSDIIDRYIIGTNLRLRIMTENDGTIAYKFTQKHELDDYRRSMTTIYLDRTAYDLLAQLPARTLQKRRIRYSHFCQLFGIDVFKGDLTGLITAEIEFDTDDAMTVGLPEFAVADITEDPRFKGGNLCQSTNSALLDHAKLAYGLALREDITA